MPDVQTVLGPIAPEALGRTLMHEHLIFELPGWELNPLVKWDRAACIARLIATVAEAKANGITTLVDATAIGVARDVPLMQEVSRATGVAIVASTGWWIVPGITSYYAAMDPDELARIMVHDLTVSAFLKDLSRRKVHRVPGTAVFMSSNPHSMPLALLHQVKHNKVLHENVILLSVITADVPAVTARNGSSSRTWGRGSRASSRATATRRRPTSRRRSRTRAASGSRRVPRPPRSS